MMDGIRPIGRFRRFWFFCDEVFLTAKITKGIAFFALYPLLYLNMLFSCVHFQARHFF